MMRDRTFNEVYGAGSDADDSVTGPAAAGMASLYPDPETAFLLHFTSFFLLLWDLCDRQIELSADHVIHRHIGLSHPRWHSNRTGQ